MYREVVGSSGCFRAPETKNDAPDGNRAHQAAVHLRRSVPEPDERTLRVQDGRSREGCAMSMARSKTIFPRTTNQDFTTCLYTQIHVVCNSGCTGRKCTTCGPSCVSDRVNHHTFTTCLVAPSHNTSATSTRLSPRGLTICGCPTFEQLKLSHPHNNAKRRGR